MKWQLITFGNIYKMIKQDQNHKSVLITGVSSGIGKATVEVFANAGWQVIGVDKSNLSLSNLFFQGDISQSSLWEKIALTLKEKKIMLTAIVNNAAMQISKPLRETTLSEWDQIMAVNLRSVYLSVYHLADYINQQKGAMVNVSSVHAVATSNNIAAYATTKGGLLALTRALAIELAPIRVNAVLPGAVDTPMLRSGLERGHLQGENTEDLVKELANKHIMGRIGKPSEIAEAIYFLTDSDRSSFMTGQSLVIDRGATARLSTE